MRQLTVSDFIHSYQDFTLPSGGQLFQSVLKVGFHFMWYKQGKNSPTWLIKTNPEKCYSLYHSHPPEWIVNSLGGTEYTLGFKNLTCHPPMASIINANISGAQKYPGFRIYLIQKKKKKKTPPTFWWLFPCWKEGASFQQGKSKQSVLKWLIFKTWPHYSSEHSRHRLLFLPLLFLPRVEETKKREKGIYLWYVNLVFRVKNENVRQQWSWLFKRYISFFFLVKQNG